MYKFEVGRRYSATSPCDHNCVWTFTVTKRTDKSVWIKDEDGKVVRKSIQVWGDTESVLPFGKFSMCPVLRARK